MRLRHALPGPANPDPVLSMPMLRDEGRDRPRPPCLRLGDSIGFPEPAADHLMAQSHPNGPLSARGRNAPALGEGNCIWVRLSRETRLRFGFLHSSQPPIPSQIHSPAAPISPRSPGLRPLAAETLHWSVSGTPLAPRTVRPAPGQAHPRGGRVVDARSERPARKRLRHKVVRRGLRTAPTLGRAWPSFRSPGGAGQVAGRCRIRAGKVNA